MHFYFITVLSFVKVLYMRTIAPMYHYVFIQFIIYLSSV